MPSQYKYSLLFAALFSLLNFSGGTYAAQVIDHDAYDKVLKSVVKNGLVDYVALKKKHRSELKSYLDHLSKVDVKAYSRNEQIAYYTNLYNATVLFTVADRYRRGYSVSEKSYGIFKEKIVRLKGRTVTLDELEKKIMLPAFKEPRLHVTLVCGAYSCPQLLNRAYRGATVEEDMAAQTRLFLADSKRNRIDHGRRQLQLSKIFEWYKADFKPDVPAYINQYVDKDVRRYKVSYLKYDWSVNQAD